MINLLDFDGLTENEGMPQPAAAMCVCVCALASISFLHFFHLLRPYQFISWEKSEREGE